MIIVNFIATLTEALAFQLHIVEFITVCFISSL